jgi:DNA-binding HxlR family transcriptional regulator
LPKTAPILTDNMIIADLQQHGASMTYVIRNRLSRGKPGLTTGHIRQRLNRMEREGIVVRTPSSYSVMICWKLPDGANG